ncbi:MAG: exodeoxyribonuclease VII large subunit [Verrucomicrobiota bacterium]|nr:exodeoxyribonuclease VII large subunit [Verrucomicrobiota bacterium]
MNSAMRAGPGDAEPKVFTVSELTRLIKSLLESEVGHVWVEGELSNVRRPSSGHCYFTVKDADAQIAGVLFRGDRRGVRFELKDGIRARIFGQIGVYERAGNYQIVARRMEPGGKGLLQAQFEALKEELRKEGLFDAARKKPIPLLPQHVGIVTSPTGAAIRDILNILGRRYPNLHILLAPARVQGEGAAEEIAAAIDEMNRRGGIDVLIIGRGGGSLEDLWCFNDEITARAIARSAIPVISAVGHEIDFTISDFVADLRAPTPSAAAELLVGRKEDFQKSLDDTGRRLARALRESALAAKNRLLQADGSYVFREPGNLVRQYAQRLDGLDLRSLRRIGESLADRKRRFEDGRMTIARAARLWHQGCAQEVRRIETQLQALNPIAVLNRGYSVTRDGQGRIVRSAAAVKAGDRVRTLVAEGEFGSVVE